MPTCKHKYWGRRFGINARQCCACLDFIALGPATVSLSSWKEELAAGIAFDTENHADFRLKIASDIHHRDENFLMADIFDLAITIRKEVVR